MLVSSVHVAKKSNFFDSIVGAVTHFNGTSRVVICADNAVRRNVVNRHSCFGVSLCCWTAIVGRTTTTTTTLTYVESHVVDFHYCMSF